MVKKLGPLFIEHIHDVLVGVFLPFDEKVNPAEYRSHASIESAASRPFQTAFENEIYPELHQKAAALFHSLVCNHCFINGNKRTAVIGLDLFLAVNEHILLMAPHEVYEIAKSTATANQEGRNPDDVVLDLSAKIEHSSISFEILRSDPARELLGNDYDKIAAHVARITDFALKLTEYLPR